MSGLRLFLLGPSRLEREGVPLQLQYRENVAMTAQPRNADALGALLWPELDQSGARAEV